MHWIIYAELKKFVELRLGPDRWDTILIAAKLGAAKFVAGQNRPDSDAAAIVGAAARLTGTPAQQLLESFGEFLVPDLLKFYGNLVRPEWRTLDVIQNAEQAIHTIVRVNDSTARPPKLACERTAKDTVTIRYDSPRQMCGVARGIVNGLAAHYREKVRVTEPRCMHAGALSCEIRVRSLH